MFLKCSFVLFFRRSKLYECCEGRALLYAQTEKQAIRLRKGAVSGIVQIFGITFMFMTNNECFLPISAFAKTSIMAMHLALKQSIFSRDLSNILGARSFYYGLTQYCRPLEQI